MDQKDLWHQDEDTQEHTGEQIQVQEPFDKGKEGNKASAKVSFHITKTPVPQLNLRYHFSQPALSLWTKSNPMLYHNHNSLLA